MYYKTLRLVLGDQLNAKHTWFEQKDDSVLYVMMEMRQETDYALHHVQKVVAFFAAMRQFAADLKQQGHQVFYFKILDAENRQNLEKNVSFLIEKYKIKKFEYLLPDEYRLDVQLESLSKQLEAQQIEVSSYDTEHFLTSRHFLSDFFEGKKTYLMEFFYRTLRKKYQVLMQDSDKPLFEKWNFDAENRKAYNGKVALPPAFHFQNKTIIYTEILTEIQQAGVQTLGKIDPAHFEWTTDRTESLLLLDHFCKYSLPYFGTFQDAMYTQSTLLFHAKISFALNIKLLHPLEVIEKAVAVWQDKQFDYAQIEGFVRQILGWREYMRGVYWAQMPDYQTLNFFNHQNKLPSWFWTGETKANCLRHCIGQSLEKSYAHHIQRLMVTGNFALLAAIEPSEVDSWYLGIYADAIEWVEITNTRGMSQFADGGLVATKPYVSSANYINKMSNYCKNCFYNEKTKYGARACPFNSLYWDFYERNREKLEKNPRVSLMYKQWEKYDKEEQAKILAQAEFYKTNIEEI
ncbi:cryptochrome/photolyase family protein [Hugenholtzia roseola]|uniref:cryptochrome/photolyase family protein n=1 Tax=Hugenholtzia roseola TaxID=1002 RepID=UPI0004050C38|nr:cryptochrome/photolyase family protein [Hugenholtzia roseola]